MTTLSDMKNRNRDVSCVASLVGIIANDIVYGGALVGDDGNGEGRPLVAGDAPLGWAKDTVNNTGGAANALKIELDTFGRVQLAVSGAADTDIGRAVYASDDDTFTFTASGNSYVGRVARYVSSGVVVVQYDFTGTVLGKMTPVDHSALTTAVGASTFGNTFTAPAASTNATWMAAGIKRVNERLDELQKMICK